MILEQLPQIFYQIPLVVIFLWFVMQIRKEDAAEREKIRGERRAERQEYLAALDKLADQMQCVSDKLDEIAHR